MYYGTHIKLVVFIIILIIIIIVPYWGFILRYSRRITQITKRKLTKGNKFIKENREKLEKIYKEEYHDLRPYKLGIILSFLLLIGLIISAFFVKDEMYTYISLGIALIILTVFSYRYNYKNYGKYEEIVKKFLLHYDSDLEYLPNKGFTIYDYYTCLFREKCNRFSSEDMIINYNKDFCYSDILVESEHTDSDDNTYYVTEFKGSLARTVIENVGCRIFLGSTSGKLIYGSDTFESIKFENDEFNKLFRACTDNELLAYKLLTPDVMEKFVDIKKNTYGDIDIRIIYDKLYIRFLTGDTFDGVGFNKDLEKKRLFESIAVLEEVMKTMDKVKELINNKNID